MLLSDEVIKNKILEKNFLKNNEIVENFSV